MQINFSAIIIRQSKGKVKILIQFKIGNRWRTRFDNCNRKYGRRKQTSFRTQCIGWLVSEGVWIRWRISLHKNRNCIHNWRRSNATICSRRIKGESKYFSNLSSKIMTTCYVSCNQCRFYCRAGIFLLVLAKVSSS